MGWIGNTDLYTIKSSLDKRDRVPITDWKTQRLKQGELSQIGGLFTRASFIAEFDASPLSTTFSNPLFSDRKIEEIQAFDENGIDVLRKPEASKPDPNQSDADTITYTEGFSGKYLFILGSTGTSFAELARKWAMNPEDEPVVESPDEFSALHWALKSEGFAEEAKNAAESSLKWIYIAWADDDQGGGFSTSTQKDYIQILVSSEEIQNPSLGDFTGTWLKITGNNGWTAELATVEDGDRRVMQVIDWFGGEGTKPDTGQYVGSGGFVTDIAQAVDIRGEEGTDGVDGVGIASIQLISTVGLEKTYRITFTDASTFDYVVTDGEDGQDGASGNLLNEVDLGSVSGAVALDLSAGSTFVATLTDSITLSFTNVPTAGSGIVLDFTNPEQIIFPAGANATDGEIREADGTRYKYIVTVRAANDYDVDGLIDNIEAVV